MLAAHAAEVEAFLRSLANRHCLMILCTLLEGETSVGELIRRLGLTQSNLSRHLATLREEGLVAGVVIHYGTAERVRPILAELYNLICTPVPHPLRRHSWSRSRLLPLPSAAP